MSRIIIGIHGMGNKPEPRQLQIWWKAAIREGLAGKGFFLFLNFKLVYWASILHHTPLISNSSDEHDPYLLKEPYTKGHHLSELKAGSPLKIWIREHINNQIEKVLLEEDGTQNFSILTDFILRHFVKDLAAYYGESSQFDPSLRDSICRKLADTLKKHRHKKILLIAHSMGSIIAWDVLTKYVPHIKIDTFVTIGSPLGIPVVKNRMLRDLRQKGEMSPALKTPENIQQAWYNLADFKDRVAFNTDLRNDFQSNSRNIRPEDFLVYNNYEKDGRENHHKSYGYLRCPDMGDILSRFLKRK